MYVNKRKRAYLNIKWECDTLDSIAYTQQNPSTTLRYVVLHKLADQYQIKLNLGLLYWSSDIRDKRSSK